MKKIITELHFRLLSVRVLKLMHRHQKQSIHNSLAVSMLPRSIKKLFHYALKMCFKIYLQEEQLNKNVGGYPTAAMACDDSKQLHTRLHHTTW